MSDRKYRHRGYQDSDHEDRPKAPRQQDETLRSPRLEGAPRGRTVGAPQEAVFRCAVCGHKAPLLGDVAPDAACAGCGKPLHTCTNCTFFDSGARFECRKPIPQRIESKTKANTCELFQPKAVRDLQARGPAAPQDARSAFDALFKKS